MWTSVHSLADRLCICYYCFKHLSFLFFFLIYVCPWKAISIQTVLYYPETYKADRKHFNIVWKAFTAPGSWHPPHGLREGRRLWIYQPQLINSSLWVNKGFMSLFWGSFLDRSLLITLASEKKLTGFKISVKYWCFNGKPWSRRVRKCEMKEKLPALTFLLPVIKGWL